MRYVSVCAGIEAATVAWHHLGWEPAWFSEIEPFPSAVLAHHYPKVKNLGDMTRFETWPDATIELLCGGTPCQSFSVAGLRQGLADPRGNLMLTFLAIARRYRPRWIVWENVPGVLSSNGGRDFGTFLGALGELGYGFAYRVLDAQWFGVAQRRRRVFVVGCLGNWRRAVAVLFERESVRRDSAPSREKGQETAQCLTTGVGKRYDAESETLPVTFSKTHKPMSATDAKGWSQIEAAPTVTHWPRDRSDTGTDVAVVQPITFGAQMSTPQTDVDMVQTLQANPMAVAFSAKDYGADASEIAPTLRAMGHTASHANGGGQVAVAQSVAFHPTQDPISSVDGTTHAMGCGSKHGTATVAVAQPVAVDFRHTDLTGNTAHTLQAKKTGGYSLNFQPGVMTAQPVAFAENFNAIDEVEVAPAMTTSGYSTNQNAGGLGLRQMMQVRRLTPVECERLQGFPDNYTNIPWRKKDESPDGPRYKALGNSMAVPVMRWIGERIAKVDA